MDERMAGLAQDDPVAGTVLVLVPHVTPPAVVPRPTDPTASDTVPVVAVLNDDP
jgi:hypothetical protein